MTAVLERMAAEVAAHAGRIDTEVLQEAVTIALAGGPERTSPDWAQWASCHGGGDTDDLYASGSNTTGRELLRRCREDCSVQAECLAAALGCGEREGIWGGTTKASRLRLRQKLREAGLLGVVGEEAYVAWRDENADREPTPPSPRPPITKPWPHQADAVQAIVDEISAGGTCQVAMATASGKTHVSLWVAHELHADLVLILVPSLSLITQTAGVWASDDRWADTPMLAVCSDTGPGELDATTDPAEVQAIAAGGRAVVLATYQSSQVLVDAGVEFDLIVADEAHHLAGDPDKAYAAVVRREIPTRRTLYMTATPRRYRRRRSRPDVDLVSMDDPAAFGRRVFAFSLSDAIAAGVVADYRVIVAAVDRRTFDRVAKHPALAEVDPHLLAGAIAVVEAMGQQDLSSCVSFHTRVDRARRFAQLVGDVAELLPEIRPDGPGWAGFVHGGASVNIRERLLARLADTQTWGILANAKALGEGVDLPALDAVAIVDPKNSETDVLQATGRALRLSGAKVGTVLLPVLLKPNADPEDPLSSLDPRSLEVVSGVLRALRAHDTDLAARLDDTRRGIAKRTGAGGEDTHAFLQALRQRAATGLLTSRLELHLPGGAVGDLAGAMALHLIREATSSWDEAFGRLQAWADDHGNCRIPQSTPITTSDDAKSFTLGGWASRQRTLHRAGLLAPDRVTALESLPGWMWNARDEPWWERLELLREFIETEGRYPGSQEEWRGDKLGTFLNTCRTAHNTGGWILEFPDRIAALEALPGFVWNTDDAKWERAFALLEQWAHQNGHAHPSNNVIVDGVNLGTWCAKQREKINGGRQHRKGKPPILLSAERTARLRALPGWVDDFRQISDQLWEDGFARTRRYMELHGKGVPQSHVEPDGYRLGAWSLKQRQGYVNPEHRRGSLNEERIALLEAIPGWTWKPLEAAWQTKFDALARLAPDRLDRDGTLVLPKDGIDGWDVSGWATWLRKEHANGRLSAEKVAALETIPGWTWNAPRGPRRIAS